MVRRKASKTVTFAMAMATLSVCLTLDGTRTSHAQAPYQPGGAPQLGATYQPGIGGPYQPGGAPQPGATYPPGIGGPFQPVGAPQPGVGGTYQPGGVPQPGATYRPGTR